MQLLKHLSRSPLAASFTRPAYLATSALRQRAFSTGKPAAVHDGNETSYSDVADILKVNYTVEFE